LHLHCNHVVVALTLADGDFFYPKPCVRSFKS
jgi:hypothetical protein